LDVVGTISATGNSGLIGIFNDSATVSAINANTGARLDLRSGNVSRLSVMSVGNVGIGTTGPLASALLDLTSTTSGFLPPRMTTAQRDAIASPATGLVVFNTTTNALNLYNGTTWVAVGVGAGSSTDVQTFNASGTWTKPASGVSTTIECWGGGGSGRRDSSSGGSGGGGGGYVLRKIDTASLGATETVTIGAGGASKTSNGGGNAGGNSTFGAWVTAYGGAGGAGSASPGYFGGGGGGPRSAGSGEIGGSPSSGGTPGNGGGNTVQAQGGIYHGGGGGFGGMSGSGNAGAGSVFGGGGGGGTEGTSSSPGGTSINGGDGGASNYNSNNATAGSQPGGGGGGSESGNSGAGGAGKCIATTI
jgi:hypothetical protein